MQTYYFAYFIFLIRCLKELMSSFNTTANLLLEHLGTMADGKTEVCMYDQFARAALDVICKVKCKYLPILKRQSIWQMLPLYIKYTVFLILCFFVGFDRSALEWI